MRTCPARPTVVHHSGASHRTAGVFGTGAVLNCPCANPRGTGRPMLTAVFWPQRTSASARQPFTPAPPHGAQHAMQATDILTDMQNRLAQLLAQSPARDIEQNVRALLQQGFGKLDLATREQLELQAELLARTRARLIELETRVAALEAERAQRPGP